MRYTYAVFSKVHSNARAYFLASRAALTASCSSAVFSVELSVDMHRCVTILGATAGMTNPTCPTVNAGLLVVAAVPATTVLLVTANAATAGNRRDNTADSNSVAAVIMIQPRIAFEERKSRFTIERNTEHCTAQKNISIDQVPMGYYSMYSQSVSEW